MNSIGNGGIGKFWAKKITLKKLITFVGVRTIFDFSTINNKRAILANF